MADKGTSKTTFRDFISRLVPNFGKKFYRYSVSTKYHKYSGDIESFETKGAVPPSQTTVAEDNVTGQAEAQRKQQDPFKQMLQKQPVAAAPLRNVYQSQWTEKSSSVGELLSSGPNRSPYDDKCTTECSTMTLLLLLVTTMVIITVFGLTRSRPRETTTTEYTSRSDPYYVPWDFYPASGPTADTPTTAHDSPMTTSHETTHTTLETAEEKQTTTSTGLPSTISNASRTPINHEENATDTDHSNSSRRSVCVYQSRSEHHVVLGSEYGLLLFHRPTIYCHVVLYCCLSLSSHYTIVAQTGNPASYRLFSSLTSANAGGRPFAILGGTSGDDGLFDGLLHRRKVRKAFIKNAITWCERNNFSGIYLYWKSPPANMTYALNQLVKEVSRGLADGSHRLGLVIEQDPVVYSYFDLDAIATVLDSIILVPRHYSEQDYTPHAFRYYSNGTIDDVSTFTSNLTETFRQKTCLLLPARALTFQLQRNASPSETEPLSIGPGLQGSITRVRGQLAYYERCHMVANNCSHLRTEYGEAAVCGDTWTAYPALPDLPHFACDIERASGINCLGVWDSDWDDFTGTCGHGDFPLTKAVFERVVSNPC
ncbi:chitinase-3-like protein 1 [Ornithodoros turicata]|uniref:chitinase-3-like protein 1 n=1 Tax=Ornithodoros turicata TaxID=34597 RepID=UPI00313A0148